MIQWKKILTKNKKQIKTQWKAAMEQTTINGNFGTLLGIRCALLIAPCGVAFKSSKTLLDIGREDYNGYLVFDNDVPDVENELRKLTLQDWLEAIRHTEGERCMKNILKNSKGSPYNSPYKEDVTALVNYMKYEDQRTYFNVLSFLVTWYIWDRKEIDELFEDTYRKVFASIQ